MAKNQTAPVCTLCISQNVSQCDVHKQQDLRVQIVESPSLMRALGRGQQVEQGRGWRRPRSPVRRAAQTPWPFQVPSGDLTALLGLAVQVVWPPQVP